MLPLPGGGPWGAQRGRSPSVIAPRCVQVYDIWDLSQRGGGQHQACRIAAGRPLIPGRPGPCPGAPYSRPQGRAEARTRPGRGSLAAHQAGAAALRRPAHTARHQGQQHRPAARHRCPSRSSARQGAPATPVLAGEGRSSGPRCQICRSSCGLHHAPRPAAARFAPPLRPLPPAAGLCGSGALHPAARQRYRAGFGGGLRPASVPARG